MSSAGLSMEDLRALVQKDIAASNELQARIDRLQQQLLDGEQPNLDQTSLMSDEHKSIGRDLILRIDQIEGQERLDATDRMMLQALTARLAVHDLQSARLAEYRDLQLRDGDEMTREWIRHDVEVLAENRRRADSEVDKWFPEYDGGVVVEIPSPPATSKSAKSGLNRETDASIPEIHVEDADQDNDDSSSTSPASKEWPLLYQIMGIDPKTPDDRFKQELDDRLKGLALKHDPRFFPNNPSAQERWEACEKAYAILAEPERRRFYHARGKVPEALVGFDISKLSIS
ncbi:hypothetical protein LTR09_004058 [Extremus antarcticus]|uniref:J domain-containing protein n=1 Tax=Extremus antarcticus TaxID=702011 RepID=A0AAJ0GD46_9PEZI|nr:hypothetical protein LTR09_004058 [Extremus antarcticus]